MSLLAQRCALVTGITGQDGAYLARLLLARGDRVVGVLRRGGTPPLWRLQALGVARHPGLELAETELTDAADCLALVRRVQPHEIYNLAAQSSVAASFEQPLATAQVTALAAVNLLEAVRQVGKGIRFLQASSAEIFSLDQAQPLTEASAFGPRNPYGVSKLFAHGMVQTYRKAWGLHAVCAIPFNHDSPLRGAEFVTRRITEGVVRLANGTLDCLELGNLDAQRDWGHAEDYVDAMVRMLQAEVADDFVLATGRATSVREFVGMALTEVGLQHRWVGQGVDEKAQSLDGRRTWIRVSPALFRPLDAPVVVGDAGKAARVLGWRPTTGVRALCAAMVQAAVAAQAGRADSSLSK